MMLKISQHTYLFYRALQSSTPVSSLTNNRRSPSRRSKSRWEPLSVDKSVDKQSPHTSDTKYSGWLNPSEGGKVTLLFSGHPLCLSSSAMFDKFKIINDVSYLYIYKLYISASADTFYMT